jgi:transcriptional regulator with GAF, ATPase, and Fis domain
MDEDKFLAFAVEQLKDPETFLTRVRDLYRENDESLDRFEFKDGRTVERVSRPQKVEGKIIARVQGFRDITDRLKTENLLRNLNARLSYLATTTNTLARSIDFNDTLKSIRRVLVPKVADAYSIDILNIHDHIECIDFNYPNISLSKMGKEVRQRSAFDLLAMTGVPKVLRTGKPEIYSETSDMILHEAFPNERFGKVLEQMKIYSLILIPLSIRGKTFAVISLLSANADRHFTWDDLRFSEEIGSRIAIALDNALLYSRRDKTPAKLGPVNIPNVLLNLKRLPLWKTR